MLDGIVSIGYSKQYTDKQIALWLTTGSVDKGTWNASTNTPTLVQGVGTAGWYYHVTVGGTWDGITFNIGDTILFSATSNKWERIATGGDESDNPITIKYLKETDTAFPTTRLSGRALVVGDNCKVDNTAILEFTIQGILFDSYNDKVVWNGSAWQLEDYSVGKTNEVKVYDNTVESISGTAKHQDDINIEVTKAVKQTEWNFTTATNQWHVEHNLEKYPRVTTIDNVGNVIVGAIVYVNKNTLDVYFANDESGKLYLN